MAAILFWPQCVNQCIAVFNIVIYLTWLWCRGVTIRVPHDTIRISIQRSRYNTYLDMYLNTVTCQMDVMSSMKAGTPVIRSTAQNLLLQWMELLLLQLPLVEPKRDFAELYHSISINLIRKMYVF